MHFSYEYVEPNNNNLAEVAGPQGRARQSNLNTHELYTLLNAIMQFSFCFKKMVKNISRSIAT